MCAHTQIKIMTYFLENYKRFKEHDNTLVGVLVMHWPCLNVNFFIYVFFGIIKLQTKSYMRYNKKSRQKQ